MYVEHQNSETLFQSGTDGKTTFLSLFLFPISLVQNTHKYLIYNNLISYGK